MDLFRRIEAAPILQRIAGRESEGSEEHEGGQEFHGPHRSRISPRCQPGAAVYPDNSRAIPSRKRLPSKTPRLLSSPFAMIIVTTPEATEAQIAHIVARIEE